MRNLRHQTRVLLALPKFFLTLGLGGGVVLFGYQIHSLNRKFSCLISYEALEKEKEKNAFYISAPCSTGEAEIDNLVSKLITVQQTIETLIKGPKALANTTDPWQLLRLIRSEAHAQDHPKALLTLASANYNEGLSREIAQACDFKTSVKLARIPEVNLNLFLQPPSFLILPFESIEDDLQKLLLNNPPSEDKCAAHFLSVAHNLTETQKDVEYILDVDTGRVGRPQNTVLVVRFYLQSILQLSLSYDISKAMVHQGLLTLLWRIVRAFPKETELLTLCTQIVANLSLHPTLHLYIFQSGWIRLLAEFMRSTVHIAPNLSAAKALLNMDEASRKHGVYDSSTYLLHPLTGVTQSLPDAAPAWDVDVIFVHGLLGGVAWTWRQSETLGINTSEYSRCWPKDWLPADVPGLRVLGLDYSTSLSHWRSRCPEERRSITSRADEVLHSLKRAGVGRRPIVFVGHSMGGLLVEQLLVNASKSNDPEVKAIVDKTKAILMLSVPHSGSNIATWSPPARFLLLPSVEVDELRKGSKVLDKLNTEFKSLITQYPIAIINLVETKATPVNSWGFEVKFVDPSTTVNVLGGEVHYIPLDHYEICKPLNRKSFVYQRLVKLLRGVRCGSSKDSLIQSPAS